MEVFPQIHFTGVPIGSINKRLKCCNNLGLNNVFALNIIKLYQSSETVGEPSHKFFEFRI